MSLVLEAVLSVTDTTGHVFTYAWVGWTLLITADREPSDEKE